MKNKSWRCIKSCGACCFLEPEERSEALEVLSEVDKKLYLNMVGQDGWCKHFDKVRKNCLIYADRPSFCRVTNLTNLFDISLDELNEFSISCCKQQIRNRYGGRSKTMKLFLQTINVS